MIRLEHVTYHYKEKERANLGGISLEISEGEFIVIAGKSGCGKTTLAKCINGLIPHFEEGYLEGNIRIKGKNTKELQIGQIGAATGSVFQDPRSQFFTTTVFDELVFGCRNAGLPREEILRRIDMTLKELGIEKLRDRSLFSLSSGEKQKIAIASCYCMKPQVFLFDEPSANLDPQSVEELKRILRKLKEMGHTILVLEHRLYYLHDLMDRFVVMEEGVIQKEIGKDELPSVTDKQLASMGLRGFHPTKLPHSDIFINCDEQIKQAALLELTHLSFQYDKKEKAVFEKLNLKMRRGEIVALVGDNGVGKTTFAKVLTGLLKEQSGAIRINERNVNQKQRLKEIYYVLQDSDYQLFAESVENELLMKTELTEKKKNEMEYLLSEFELEPYKKCHPMALSRGQKQRVTIAAAMMSEAKILVLDEPSSGLDGDSMRKLAMLITKIAHTGKAVLIISHDVEFIEICCQRVVELKEGGFYEQTI